MKEPSGNFFYRRRRRAIVPSAVTLIHDQFTDADGTLLSAHTIAPTNTPAASWAADYGGISGASITGNAVVSGATFLANTLNSGVVPVTITISVTNAGSMVFYCLYRYNTNANFFTAEWAGGQLIISTRIAASTTLRASTAAAWATSETKTVTVTDNGTLVTVSLSTGESVSYSSTSLNTNTRQGFLAQNAVIDNFQVTTP